MKIFRLSKCQYVMEGLSEICRQELFFASKEDAQIELDRLVEARSILNDSTYRFTIEEVEVIE